MSNRFVKRHDTFLVRYLDDDAMKDHIVEITNDNRLDFSLCGIQAEWSRRGGSIKIYETHCAECNRIAREKGILK